MDGEKAMTLGELNRLPISVRLGAGVVIALVLVIYVFYPAYPTATGKSLAGWTWAACNRANESLHGRLVPLIFPWLVWWALRVRKGNEVKPSYWGLVLIGLGLFFFFASVRAVQPRLAMFGVPFLVLGLTFYCFGGKTAKAMIFPAFFWWFAIPLPGLESKIAGMWQMEKVTASYELGKAMGMDLTLNGETIGVGSAEMSVAHR